MSAKIRKMYRIKQESLPIQAGVRGESFTKYQSRFTEFHPSAFPVDYVARVLTPKITAVQEVLSDEFVVAGQAKETMDMKDAVHALVKELRSLGFTVKLVFGGNAVVMEKFLLNKLSVKARNPDTLLTFTKDLLTTVEEFNSALLDGGMKEDCVEKIRQAYKALDKVRREQIDLIKARPSLTQQRILLLNELWKELQMLHNASKIIFEDERVIKKLFDLPTPRKLRSKSVEAAISE